jgi:hypothetical protein
MLGAMSRPLGVLCMFMIGCTSSAPSEDAAKQAEADAKKALEDKLEATKADARNAALDAKKAQQEALKAEQEAMKREEDAKKAEAQQLAALNGTPVFVMLGGSGSRTSKPVPNALLAHSWGWGSVSAADTAACEAKATSPGQLMSCGTEDKPKDAAKLVATLEPEGGKSVFVTPEQIASWNIPAPTGPVWLFGPTQACKATVGRPLIGWYSIDADAEAEDEDAGESAKPKAPDLSDVFTVLELAWELTGCDAAGEGWAPIGVVAASFDPTTRWVPMKAGDRQRFDLATYTGPLASEVAKLPEAAKAREDAEPVTGDPEWHTQTFELPGTEIRELYFAAAWRGPDGSKAPDEYSYRDSEFGEVFQVRLAASGPTMIGHGSRGKLVGALVAGAEVHTMVWTDSLDYQVATLEPTGLGAPIDLSTGVYYPEDGGERHYTLLAYCGP